MPDTGDLHIRIGRATIVGVIGIALAITVLILYLGSTMRQIEVNSARLNDIEQHGTGILQALKLQVQTHDTAINAINQQFRTREFWEQLERRLSMIETTLAKRDPEFRPTPPQQLVPMPPILAPTPAPPVVPVVPRSKQ